MKKPEFRDFLVKGLNPQTISWDQAYEAVNVFSPEERAKKVLYKEVAILECIALYTRRLLIFWIRPGYGPAPFKDYFMFIPIPDDALKYKTVLEKYSCIKADVIRKIKELREKICKKLDLRGDCDSICMLGFLFLIRGDKA